jgi:small-conductance mechanosensitive channel
MSQYLSKEAVRLIIASALFIVLGAIIYVIYRRLFKFFTKKVTSAAGRRGDAILNLFKIPSLWITYWVLLQIYTHVLFSEYLIFPYLAHVNNLLLNFSITWVLIQFVKAGSYYLQGKLDTGTEDNLRARKSLTQIKVFRAIIISLIIIISLALALLTFKEVRNIGISMLTSAGIIGIIVGFAAQKSLGMILAGIQLALTQPIRLDDVVIVEGEWGRIEEITLTYVVVKIWDERRLILPVTWFLEKPFQNWTRTNAEITGTVFLYVDYSFPVGSIRTVLSGILTGDPNWDGRTANVQVTNATEKFKEIRILLSSSTSSKNWDLRVAVREKLIDYININYPDSFARIRIKNE